ncbi:MAG: putative Fibronectin type III superfamily, partial [Nitrosopumilus sp.]|nr:putative Fibronectin type III superfamily [Candidatus Nitrosopumilus limneticus]
MVENKLIIIISVLVVLSVIAISVEPVFAAVPSAPINLRVDGIPSETSITLKWTQPTSGAPTGYKIYRASPLPNTFNQFGDYAEVLVNQTNVNAATVTYRNSALTAGQPFSWKVLAFNNEGDSAFTAPLMAGTIFASGGINFGNGVQNFQQGQTFGSGATFTSGQTFSGTQTFGSNTQFGSGTIFASGQAFTGTQNFDTSSMKFSSGSTFNTAQTFGTGANFSGAQIFVGSNTFGSSAKFGAGQTFGTAQTFGAST